MLVQSYNPQKEGGWCLESLQLHQPIEQSLCPIPIILREKLDGHITVTSASSADCVTAALRFFGLGTGLMYLASHRRSMIFCVGCPASSSSQCLDGYS